MGQGNKMKKWPGQTDQTDLETWKSWFSNVLVRLVWSVFGQNYGMDSVYANAVTLHSFIVFHFQTPQKSLIHISDSAFQLIDKNSANPSFIHNGIGATD